MSTCHVCEARTDAYLCRACTRVLEQTIAELPADLRDLQLVATRQATGPLGVNRYRLWDGPHADGSLGDAPWDFAPGAADQLWAASNTITTWVRHLCESRKIDPPDAVGTWLPGRRLAVIRNRACWVPIRVFVPSPFQPMRPLVEWLLSNIDAIRYDEAAEQIHDEITGLHVENERWTLGRRGTEVFAGQCDASQVSFELGDDGTLTPIAATCGAGLYGHDGELDVRCQTCGTRYPLAARMADMQRRQIDEQLARAHVIADALTTLERPLGRDRLRKWIERDARRPKPPHGPACESCEHSTCRLIRKPPIHAQSIDEDGHPLYRVGDVRRRLLLTAPRVSERLSA